MKKPAKRPPLRGMIKRPLTDPTTLGGRLYISRTKRGLSIFELAEMTGLGVVTIRGLEAGTVTTTPWNLSRLSIALDIDAQWLQKGRVAA